MAASAASLRAFLASRPSLALVQVEEAKGSTPRETGAWMIVAPDAILGTIGGGQLEFLAIARAREAVALSLSSRAPIQRDHLAQPRPSATPPPSLEGGGKAAASLSLDIPLGPEIGQCCGGRVRLSIRLMDAALRDEIVARAEAEDARQPAVFLFGGGHVGHALAAALGLLPLRVTMVETRADALAGLPEAVEARLTPVPEEVVRTASPGSAYVVLTHDHALDFLIVAEALKREDAAYVGMIGSATKKETFRRWYLKEAGGNEADLGRLVTPLGGHNVRDKRPAVIAALAAAEIMAALA
jgi:xanthine dehydrogenase accessory factor